MNDIERCHKCRDYFLSRPLMQAEVKHEPTESAAKSLMLELMEPIHEQHTQEEVDDG